MSIDLSQVRDVLVNAVLEVGRTIRDASSAGVNRNVRQKSSSADLVTQTDIEVNRKLIEILSDKYPESNIISEENDIQIGSCSSQLDEVGTFYVDPIDGSMNFVHGFPEIAISIGYVENDTPVVGVVANPLTDTVFHAVRGDGSFKNDGKISVSRTERLIHGLISSGWPYDKARLKAVSEELENVCRVAREIRMIGSAALSVCYVAEGVFDGYWEQGLFPWDLVGASVIAEEAGATISRHDGSQYSIDSHEILVTNGKIHGELLDVVKRKILLEEV